MELREEPINRPMDKDAVCVCVCVCDKDAVCVCVCVRVYAVEYYSALKKNEMISCKTTCKYHVKEQT